MRRGAEPAGLPDGLDLSQVSVVVPAYNEAGGIVRTLTELRDACPEAEIVVVDDGSHDGTAAFAAGVDGVRVVVHPRNRGYGAALKTGIRAATRGVIVWYDADGQHRPADLLAVAAPVLHGEVDAAIGMRGQDSAVQRNRVPGKLVLRWVARLVSGERIPDLNSGLRCVRRDVLLRYLHLLPDGFSASTTSTLLFMKRGYRVGWAPITARERVGVSTVKVVSDGLRAVQLVVRIVVLFEAFRVFMSLGLGLLVPGLVYGVVVAIVRGQGFPTLAGTAVIAGLLTIFMGIVADQVAELRKERLEIATLDAESRAAAEDAARLLPR